MTLPKHRAMPLIVGMALSLVFAQAACDTEPSTDGADTSGVDLQYGPPMTLGEGQVRTYVVLEKGPERKPLEIGVAMDARTLEGNLPDGDRVSITLEFPDPVPEPYEFVMFDWNPQGHIPEGIYDVPHFDVHFYRTPYAEVQAIRPEDPDFAKKANNLPTGDFVPPNYIVPTPPGLEPVALAQPMMGLHWEDARTPELQRLLGHPDAYRPFDKTFLYGSWDGWMTFVEPMITREYLLRRTDETIEVPRPARYPEPGWYPGAYRITYDAQAKEYRVAIVDFERRD
ncbi:MAG TPA: hypothetical protein VF188_03675 [Longimicrobiales bacterium]